MDAPALDGDTPMAGTVEVADPVDLDLDPTLTLASAGPADRVAFNLEVAGWIVVASSAPALGFAPSSINCRRGRGGRGSGGAPGTFVGVTLGIGAAVAIAGSILRARSMRGVPRTGIPERQALFRVPWARGVGLASLGVGTAISTMLATLYRVADQCLD